MCIENSNLMLYIHSSFYDNIFFNYLQQNRLSYGYFTCEYTILSKFKIQMLYFC